MAAVVFLDRDGTIIEDAHYPKDPKKVRLLDGAVAGLKLLSEKGYRLYVLSNQSGVGRGLITDREFEAVHGRVCELLQEEGVQIDGFAYCLHHPDDGCECRKPALGLVPPSVGDLSVERERSFVVGDRASDLQLGLAGSMRPVLVRSGLGSETESTLPAPWKAKVQVVDTLLQFAEGLPPAHSLGQA